MAVRSFNGSAYGGRNTEEDGHIGRTGREHIDKTDALATLLIAKGVITNEEFKAQLSAAERANYVAVLKELH